MVPFLAGIMLAQDVLPDVAQEIQENGADTLLFPDFVGEPILEPLEAEPAPIFELGPPSATADLVVGVVGQAGELGDQLTPELVDELVLGTGELALSAVETGARGVREVVPTPVLDLGVELGGLVGDGATVVLGFVAEALPEPVKPPLADAAEVVKAVADGVQQVVPIPTTPGQARREARAEEQAQIEALEDQRTALRSCQPRLAGQVRVASELLLDIEGSTAFGVTGCATLDQDTWGQAQTARDARSAAQHDALQLAGLGAQPVVPDAYDVVAVGRPQGWDCTGVLVGPDMVLTAAHCPHPTQVLFGDRVDQPLSVIPVRYRVVHPEGLDVAVLALDRPVSVKPRPTWRQPVAPTGSLYAVGFGLTADGADSQAGVKHQIGLHNDGWDCADGDARSLGCDPGAEMVVRSHFGEDTCEGDSGGPLFTEIGGQRVLVAIVSRSLASADTACGAGGVYTRLDTITPWLRGAIRKNTLLSSDRWGEHGTGNDAAVDRGGGGG